MPEIFTHPLELPWEGARLIVEVTPSQGVAIIIAIHSTALGPATGGTRIKSYDSLAAAVIDAQRLAEGMTCKFAVAGLKRGGAKAVILAPETWSPELRRATLLRYGSLVQSLGGAFQTGPDVGSTPEDMDVIGETGSPFVFGKTLEAGGAGDSGPYTAAGVAEAMQAACGKVFGTENLSGRRVLVQGTGAVGSHLIALLREAGADVWATDVNQEKLHSVIEKYHIRTVHPDKIFENQYDVFSPCALGGILTVEAVKKISCKIIAGGANNQLAEPAVMQALGRKGIWYIPDFAVNIGGALAIPGIELEKWSIDEAYNKVRQTVRQTLETLFRLAPEGTPDFESIARKLAKENLNQSQIQLI
ncbi:MAG: hypothetical protein K1Y36_24075 [Blastocatellia bacterium]|nr:hypothetical protein [Blastocatellia bacterium]